MLKLHKRYVLLFLLLLLIVIIRTFLITTYNVAGSSMAPSFHTGDKVIVTKVYKNLSTNDVIVFKQDGKVYMKRIKAVPKQKVHFDNKEKVLTINREKVQGCCKEYTYHINNMYHNEIEVPEKQFFVMGDNILDSIDSREFGFVSETQVIGKVAFRFWPIFQDPTKDKAVHFN